MQVGTKSGLFFPFCCRSVAKVMPDFEIFSGGQNINSWLPGSEKFCSLLLPQNRNKIFSGRSLISITIMRDAFSCQRAGIPTGLAGIVKCKFT